MWKKWLKEHSSPIGRHNHYSGCSISMCSFDLILTLATYFHFQLSVLFFKRYVGCCTQGYGEYMDIIYLQMDYNLQLPLKHRCCFFLVCFCFCSWFWQHICEIHVSQWSFWSNVQLSWCLLEHQHLAGLCCLGKSFQIRKDEGYVHFIPTKDRIMSWWFTVRPKFNLLKHHLEL